MPAEAWRKRRQCCRTAGPSQNHPGHRPSRPAIPSHGPARPRTAIPHRQIRAGSEPRQTFAVALRLKLSALSTHWLLQNPTVSTVALTHWLLRHRPRAPLVTESAQQMRKWQAGWPWGLLFGLAPSEPSTTACLASTGESGPSTGGLSSARAPCLDGLAQPCPALPCPGCGRGCPEESGWEVPALWGWASPAASLLPLAPVCLHLGLPPPPPHLAPQSLTSPCPLLPFSLLFPSPFFCLSPFLFHLF